jgi:AcrR family transcriptional regulator
MSSSTEFPADETPNSAVPRGRRPGKADTRAKILEAAKTAFAEEGYAAASLRGIAQRAGVDPALVHHYFDGKPALFIEVLGLPRDFTVIQDEVSRSPGSEGVALVERFLTFWDPDPASERPSDWVSVVQAVSSSSPAAAAYNEFLAERIWSRVARDPDDPEWLVRRWLVASQLVGMAFERYVLRLEPLASAPPAEMARWVGPTIDHYLDGPLDIAPSASEASHRAGRSRSHSAARRR